MQLTDEDRAAIEMLQTRNRVVPEAEGRAAYTIYGADYDEYYLAGMRAGMERAAKLCDEEAALPPVGSTSYHAMWIGGAAACADDIRAAAKE